MALFTPGHSKCPICGGVLTKRDERSSTWGMFDLPPDLLRFCDDVTHWSCYADWPRRPEFAKTYFNSWVDNEPHNPFWAKAYPDDRVLVSVSRSLGEVELVLAATGSRVRVKMEEWKCWLDAPETSNGERLHSLEIAELRRVSPVLKLAIPTVDAVKNALDRESKDRPHRGSEAAEPDAATNGRDDSGTS